MDGTIGSGNNAPGPRPTPDWNTEDVMPDMDMGPAVGPEQAE
eukprot:CAMPEP_0119116308 /NCGR_PEP_ID=MMETSP1180-20130426/52213_1 /TAXON_ID=3052 ORGANISM="Chlamydomonas cf sp, Strain CCMP681" /NCGR_SAMPLE_ID=MMETSP1180 /ASSEMBLY_ACC=CAM_ASM_000741 /LENGTH=41 /DNA_ID= /DNA_START= /DNA_END= /DNA_ORIENTATION=